MKIRIVHVKLHLLLVFSVCVPLMALTEEEAKDNFDE